jgi:hypothetical protein
MKNIIFLTHAEKKPSGGAKYIYDFSETINKTKNFSSEVIHIKKNRASKLIETINKKFNFKKKKYSGWMLKDIKSVKNFKYKWFNNKIKIKNDFNFNKEKDFVILPEIFAHFAEDLLIKNNVDYSIFVQNGYCLDSTNNEKLLIKAYKNAKFILSGSNDTSKCIKLRFSKLKLKVFKIIYSINIGSINYKDKKNIITYTSRKLPHHCNLVISFLKSKLPKNWYLQNLNDLEYHQYLSKLKKSKIFLSFSNLEGLGLPPVEAALAGNHVIGYTGEGGKEYWKKPLFIKINSGEIKNFVSTVINIINSKKNFSHKNYMNLKNKFSEYNKLKSIKKILKII